MTAGLEAPDVRALAARLPGDPAVAGELYPLLAPLVLGYLRRLVPPDEAEDVLQRTFEEVWRCHDRYDPARPVQAWVLGIARHRALDHLRRRRDTPVAEVPDQPGPDLGEELAQRFAASARVRAGLSRLPAEQRRVLVLAYFDGLTQTEIAAWLDVPLGTVKARSARGLRALAAALREEGSAP